MAEETKANVSVDELRDQLDALWEKHLTLLDSYHQAQQQLARHFSSGFFHLAQATFKSTTRVRYGQEYYDDRMQATRRFEASIDDNDLPLLALNAEDATPPSNKSSTKFTDKSPEEQSRENQAEEPEQQPTPPSTPSPEEKLPKEQGEQDKTKTTDDKKKAQKKPRDPLHWYGILVPSSLRASQKSFVSAFESPVIEAANSAQALRHVALEIRKLRKDIRKAERRDV